MRQTIKQNYFALNVSVEKNLSFLHFIQSNEHLFIRTHERGMKRHWLQTLNHEQIKRYMLHN